MAKTNNSIYAILGFLNERPMTGYEIRKEAESSIGSFWRETEGHLYPTLKKMLATELIAESPEAQMTARKSKPYKITPKGRKALFTWLKEPVQPYIARNELLLKLFFAADIPAKFSIGHLEDFMKRREQLLVTLKKIKTEIAAEAEHPHYRYWLVTLNYGFMITKTQIKWANESIQQLNKE